MILPDIPDQNTPSPSRTWYERYQENKDRQSIVDWIRLGAEVRELKPIRFPAEKSGQRRYFHVVDIFSAASIDESVDAARSAMAMESWSDTFGALFVNGLVVDPSASDTILAALRGESENSATAAQIVSAHKTLSETMKPLTSADPVKILQISANNLGDEASAIWHFYFFAAQRLTERNKDLQSQLSEIRSKDFGKAISSGKKAQKAHQLERMETYLAIIARHHFQEVAALDSNKPAPHALYIAKELNNVVSQAADPKVDLSSPHSGTVKSQLVISEDRIARILQARWKQHGLDVADGRNRPAVKR